jgi:16S rRNA (cytidine1402-2'-O)-methyltransferase
MIFYEAPHKLKATLSDMADYFGGERRISLCREMTKLHEETLRMTLSEAVLYYNTAAPRGEFVLIIEGAKPCDEKEISFDEALERVRTLRDKGMPLKEAAKICAQETGYSKNELYNAAIEG